MLKKKYNLDNQMFGLEGNINWQNFRQKNIDWWNSVGKYDLKEKPTTKLINYTYFLQWLEKKFKVSTGSLNGKNVGEICCGPYGGILQACNIDAKKKYFIDIFMEDFLNMKLIEWPPNSTFIQAPSEHIHLNNDELDFLFGYNSIDHGWDWKASIDECLRVSKKIYLMFDTKNSTDGDYHPQKINHEDVIRHVGELNDTYNFTNYGIKAQLKNYGYYDTCFEWPETWIYIEK